MRGLDIPTQRFCEFVVLAFDFEDLDCFVGGAGCEAAAVVV